MCRPKAATATTGELTNSRKFLRHSLWPRFYSSRAAVLSTGGHTLTGSAALRTPAMIIIIIMIVIIMIMAPLARRTI